MSAKNSNIIVIGTSAGGLEAVDHLIRQFPTDIPASIVVVQHLAPESTGHALVERLARYRSFDCSLANDGDKLVAGKVYIAPPDHHLLVKRDHLIITKGARENRYRPAIDPLFRSAAVSLGSQVIAVLLTGMLDDGTAGLIAVKKSGGLTVVQDPKDAAYPDMPQSALTNVKVDYCVPIAEMGSLLDRLAREHPDKNNPVPEDVRTEALIAERVLSDVDQVNHLGKQVPYNCPNCGGVLWQMSATGLLRYRCHTGHSFTSAALLTSQTEKIEETLWVSLRMFEERKNLLNTMAHNEKDAARKRAYGEQATATEVHIQRIRAMLMAQTPKVLDD